MRFLPLLPLLGAVALASPMPEADSSEVSKRDDSWHIDFFKGSKKCAGEKVEHNSDNKESGCVKINASGIGSYNVVLNGWFVSVYTTEDCTLNPPHLSDGVNPGGPVKDLCEANPWDDADIKSYKFTSEAAST